MAASAFFTATPASRIPTILFRADHPQAALRLRPWLLPFPRTVKYGGSDDRVRASQSRLSELGFYTAKVSGGYYKVTKAAIKAFQSHNGLNADGIAGRETQELLLLRRRSRRRDSRPSPTREPPAIPDGRCRQPDYPRLHLRRNGEYNILVPRNDLLHQHSPISTPCGTTIMPKSAPAGVVPRHGVLMRSI